MMKTKYPTVTIGLQTHNRAKSGYLRESLEAILNQTHREFELFVLDNHSTDETAELVLGYRDPRMLYLRQPPGKTPDSSFLLGLWMGHGQYFLATHDDDVMEPTMVARTVDFLAHHPDMACLATNVSLINSPGALIQSRLYELDHDRIFEKGAYVGAYLEEKLWFPTPTCMFHRDKTLTLKRREVRATYQPYRPSEDILMLCLLNIKDRIAILADPLLRYRQHSGQESRNVNQSKPLVDTVTGLLAHRRKLKAYLPAIYAAEARYLAQDCLFAHGESLRTVALCRQIGRLKAKWEKVVPSQSRALDSVLPFEILICQLGLGPSIPAEPLEHLLQSKPQVGARRAYRQWACLAQQGKSIFAGRQGLKRIAILGSMFTAYLIVQDALRAGIEVVCCLDSAPARIGNKVFGIPVVPHEELKRLQPVDAVILSSERDHEEGLRRILQSHLSDTDLPTPSWKELVHESRVLLGGKVVRSNV